MLKFASLVFLLSSTCLGRVLDRRTTTSSLPSGWSYNGCLIDGGGTRILLQDSQVISTNTPQSCIAFCFGRGYVMAGVEYTSECWCGNGYSAAAGDVQAAPDSDCSFACSGDSKQTCGGSNRLQAYKLSGSTTTSHSSTTSSHSTTTSATSTVPASTSTAAGKRGLAWPHTNPSNQSPEVFKSPQISFLYNWGSVKTPNNKDIPYYAMQWSDYLINTLAANVSTSGAKTVLAFNEPDNPGQANLTAAQAAALYKQYIHPLAASGHYLVSPAITNGGAPSGTTWLSNFFGNCTGCHVDAIAMHWYGGWTDDLVSFVEAGKAFGKPIYLTELGFSWDADATVDSFTQFFPLAFSYLDNEPAVAKYAFFGAFSDGTAKNMIYPNGSLTEVGQLYIS